jgi:hypothetical protein
LNVCCNIHTVGRQRCQRSYSQLLGSVPCGLLCDFYTINLAASCTLYLGLGVLHTMLHMRCCHVSDKVSVHVLARRLWRN